MKASEESTVTRVDKQKRNKHRYNVHLDGEYAFSVHEDLLIKYRLLKGEVVNKDQLQTILEEDEKHRAYLDAIRFIGIRPRSVKEVRLKLKQRGYEPPLIQGTVDKLLDQNYLDDSQFAKMWAEQRVTFNKKGKKWIQAELAQKGIDRSKIQEAVEGIGEEEELTSAEDLARKKWPTLSGEEYEKKRKLYAFLMRRGYTPPS
ncbi:RecX family transcriptional regulator [Paenibacillus sp. CC-CFT747]|nr:RecX family transcriptional regulator [Paenibacillus sp. CC-CFT747]